MAPTNTPPFPSSPAEPIVPTRLGTLAGGQILHENPVGNDIESGDLTRTIHVGAIRTDSRGTRYKVQPNGSVRRMED